jgi:hypothetical protein
MDGKLRVFFLAMHEPDIGFGNSVHKIGNLALPCEADFWARVDSIGISVFEHQALSVYAAVFYAAWTGVHEREDRSSGLLKSFRGS